MGYLPMNDEERSLKAYFEMVKGKQLKLKDISHQTGLSYRQIKVLYTRWQHEDDGRLIHSFIINYNKSKYKCLFKNMVFHYWYMLI